MGPWSDSAESTVSRYESSTTLAKNDEEAVTQQHRTLRLLGTKHSLEKASKPW